MIDNDNRGFFPSDPCEPELTGPEHTPANEEQTKQWILWARERLDLYRGQTAELQQQYKECQASLHKQEEAVKGLETYLRHRKDKGVTCLEIGTEVTLGPDQLLKGKIDAVLLEHGRISYWVVWWQGDKRHCELIPSSEVSDSDVLPINQRL